MKQAQICGIATTDEHSKHCDTRVIRAWMAQEGITS